MQGGGGTFAAAVVFPGTCRGEKSFPPHTYGYLVISALWRGGEVGQRLRGRFEEGLVPWRENVFGRNGQVNSQRFDLCMHDLCQLRVVDSGIFPGTCSLLHTFSHEICPPDAVLYLFLVAQAGVGHEGLVQAGSEELVARGVLAAEVEEFCVGSSKVRLAHL